MVKPFKVTLLDESGTLSNCEERVSCEKRERQREREWTISAYHSSIRLKESSGGMVRAQLRAGPLQRQEHPITAGGK